uniref:CD5 antigen-like n=1 Tax=Phascolarctos cinereus TaxID=38626 RepID=A0A6P5KN94_PHACI|nr:CD5 antigen-like [Phascolarctos cinereus]
MILLFFMLLATGTGLGLSDLPHGMRLVGGPNPCEGRVELWKNGQWGTVCDDYWTKKTMAIVCQELQCGPGVASPAGRVYSPKAQEDQPIWNLNCQGTEAKLAECEEDIYVECNDHDEDVGVICEEILNLDDFRLVDGPSHCIGRVEVKHVGKWDTVCNAGWTFQDAEVLCQELGCGRSILTKGSYSKDEQGTGDIWPGQVECQGSEPSLSHCAVVLMEKNNCSHQDDTWVHCEEILNLDDFRLVDGPSHCIGRVEVKHAGKWDSVCNAGWTFQNAKVLCQELGCGRSILTKGSCAKDQQGTGDIWPGQVECQGSEPSLSHCAVVLMEKNNCSHQDDTWVHCEERFALRLVDGRHKCSGRLEVLHKGIWGSVCNDGWGEKEDQVVCQEVNCGKAVFQKPRDRVRFGHGKGYIWLDDVRCKGKETSLEQCKHRFWGYHDCTHREDVSVICSEK